MARIRSIKPEFWTSEQVMECSTNARLLFIGLWNFCDDAGRMAASSKRIKASVFPSDDFTAENVRRMIVELSTNGLVLLYVVDEIEYLQVTGWHHQKIDRPQKSKIPDPPDPNSPNGRRSFGVGREGNGGERKGSDSKSGGGGESQPARPLLNEAVSEPALASEPAPPPDAWNSRANFDRVRHRCRRELPPDWVNDYVVGPMVKLEHDGLDLETEIVPAIIDLVASRRVPLRTWGVLANAVAERVQVYRESRSAQGLPAKPPAPTPEAEVIDMRPHGQFSEKIVRQQVARYRDNPSTWIEAVFGPPPGQPGCKVPSRLLIGEAA